MLPSCSGSIQLKVEVVPEVAAKIQKSLIIEQNICPWTKGDCDILYWYYVQSAKIDDPIDNIRKMYVENGASSKSRVAVSKCLISCK